MSTVPEESTPTQVRSIAFYLPQYHPIPENDEWWGKGFTEWISVSRSRPLFLGHEQPILPSELGFYDLRMPEARYEQAQLAREHGIHGFCYWHYWLGHGRRILDRPFREVLASGEPDFPFCLGWANHDWVGNEFFGSGRNLLLKQEYPGEADYRAHMDVLCEAFSDHRYIRVEGKPLLLIYRPHEIPDCPRVMDLFRSLAQAQGFPDLFIVADTPPGKDPRDMGLDAGIYSGQRHLPTGAWAKQQSLSWKIRQALLQRLTRKPDERYDLREIKIIDYKEAIQYFTRPGGYRDCDYPVAIPGWDTTARLTEHALILHGRDPELFRIHFREMLNVAAAKPAGKQLLFIRAWNEWAEGNTLEPDQRFGRAFLEVVRDELMR